MEFALVHYFYVCDFSFVLCVLMLWFWHRSVSGYLQVPRVLPMKTISAPSVEYARYTWRSNFPSSEIDKPSYSTDKAAKHLTRSGSRWSDRNKDKKIDLSYTLAPGFTSAEKHRIREGLKSWAEVTNVTFTENATGRDGVLKIKGLPDYPGGWATLPNPYFEEGSVNVGTSRTHTKLEHGTQFDKTFVHEVGHAIGLKHPHGDVEPYREDTSAYTVMSYHDASFGDHPYERKKVSAPMLHDIAAVQRLYGANTETRKTDTTYGFNANAGRDFYTLKSARDKPVFCVWDAGGTDTLDFSGFRQDQKISLKAESFSDVGGMTGNVSIAKGVTVENAVGGFGHDTLIGNTANNRLTGGPGADTLEGNGGRNVFAYDNVTDSTPSHPDLIKDFASGADRIDISRPLSDAAIRVLYIVERFTGRAGEAVLSYNEGLGEGKVTLDLSGNGKADFQVNTRGRIHYTDLIVNGELPNKPAPEPVVNEVDKTDVGKPKIYTYASASESDGEHYDTLNDFVSGRDEIDLSPMAEATHTTLIQADIFTGTRGEVIVVPPDPDFDDLYSLVVDLDGDRISDFIVRSPNVIKPSDIKGVKLNSARPY
ncbi:M10 family metallopeptidase C-terminal domain-containing protein [Pseudomonas lactucae]|uniref:M10 family metallopeptidase C-terminal domain-containing protein n=1 Tax=Pseudomonas lactucae TaxID=2813360 RepID=UPI002FCD5F28